MTTGQSKGFEFIESLAKELSSKSLVFPTSLNVTMRIRSALNAPNSSIEKVAHIVGAEPVLSAHLLRLANSAAMNLSGKPVTDLHSAIPRLGYALVRNVAISVGMRQLSQSTPQGGMQPRVEKLWNHSILVAALSYVLAKKLTRLNPDEAMLAGLLHDIGAFYILTRAKNYPDLFTDEAALEDIVYQWHTEIGQAILQSWEIPEEIAATARDHELFDRVHYGPADLTDLVMVANVLANQSTPGAPDAMDWQSAPSAFARLELDADTCATVMRESEEEMKQVALALG
ncbi:MAG: HDOD domain-containing protein [Sulfuricella sp.]|nr:HDOD domain-containing protein [Sulfuricella sp.]